MDQEVILAVEDLTGFVDRLRGFEGPIWVGSRSTDEGVGYCYV